MRVLLIEDHDEVADLVRRALTKDGHRVATATGVVDADTRLSNGDFDAAILDLGLPDGDGLAWCKRVRAEGFMMPILVLTAQSAVAMRVEGLDAGADDFLAKPFAIAELRARVRALSRRGPLQQPSELTHGDVHLNFSKRIALVQGKEVPLTTREWNIVELLSSRAGRVIARREIIDRLWDEGDDGEAIDLEAAEASLEVLIGRIRKKLGAAFIRTIRGEGYAFG